MDQTDFIRAGNKFSIFCVPAEWQLEQIMHLAMEKDPIVWKNERTLEQKYHDGEIEETLPCNFKGESHKHVKVRRTY